MARHYRMSVLLEQRERELAEAEDHLTQERDAVQRRETTCEAARLRLRKARHQLTERRTNEQERAEEAFLTQQWAEERHYQQRLVGAVSARLEEVRAAEVSLAEAHQSELDARQTLLSAKRGVEVLEKDRDRFEARERQVDQRRAELEVDDFVTARYGRG